jgi:hypothetical protein
MNQSTVIRTPLHRQPISLVFKSIQQKVHRPIHCIECGYTIAQVTDKVVIASDGTIPLSRLDPDQFGIIDLRCKYHTCKQFYRLELAL